MCHRFGMKSPILSLGTILCLGTSSLLAADTPPAGFQPMFNGKDLSGWVPVNVAPETFTVRDGMIVTNGNPTGYMRSEKVYENFVMEVDWRHMKAGGNSGIFVWGDGIPALGTGYTRGIEVQVLDNAYNIKGKNEWFTTHGDIFPIWGATMTPAGRIAQRGSRSFPSEERSKSSPEWNHYRITGNNGELRLEVNGKEVTIGKDCRPRKGYISLESEGSECHFKNLFIKELPSTGAPESESHNPYTGFNSLFTGTDFRGWRVPQGDNNHWKAAGGEIDYDALSEAPGEKHLWTEKEFSNYTLILDWKIKATPYNNPTIRDIQPDGSDKLGADGKPVTLPGPDADSGILLNGSERHQVNIWNWPVGSGEMYGVRKNPASSPELKAAVTPKKRADKPVGSWNRFEITVLKKHVTVILNGEKLIDNALIPDLPDKGPIGFQHHGKKEAGEWTEAPSLIRIRSIFLKEL